MKVAKRPIETYQFYYIMLRIGNKNMAGSGAVEFTDDDNPAVGCAGATKTTLTHTFNMAEPTSGRYLTIQTLKKWYLSIDEVYVYR